MKIILLFSIIQFASCKKDPNHTLFIKNDHTELVTNIWLGEVWFENVYPGGVSNTKKVNEGDFILQVVMSNQQKVSHAISIKGEGTHKWKLAITSSTTYTLSEY